MERSMNLEKITLGTCYYPEHWPEGMWEEDLRRMLENGIEVVRVAEFAWSKIEPREGEFTYEFFDRFLETAERTGMKVIFCTPSATPPAWLTNRYPEVLNARQDGVLYRHGCRRHYNYNSPKYQELVKRIVEKSAAHYAAHPAIIGWQIDNELNCEVNEFYSESDTAAFRLFLQEKYGTLDRLNEAWGTVFWNQTYTEWEEIYVPRPTPSNSTNPHEVLDYIRFISDSTCRFARMQSDILKKYVKPGDFITTNGLFGNLDNHRMTEESLVLSPMIPTRILLIAWIPMSRTIKACGTESGAAIWRRPERFPLISALWSSSREQTAGTAVWKRPRQSRGR